MPNDYIPKKDTDLQLWLNNFVTVANANLAALGITSSQVTPIVTDSSTFNGAVQSVNQAKETLKGNVQAKDTSRKKTVADVRALVRTIQGNPAVLPALKANLGISPRNGHATLVSPVAPTGLTADGFSNGVNSLKWNRNGNHPSTVFLVEAAVGASTTFSVVTAVTATRFDHEGVIPGEKIVYRVRARRRKVVSAPSQAVTLYGGAATLSANAAAPVLELQKAA